MIGNVTFSDVLTALGDLIMPRECIVCGKSLALRERHLCIGCLADLPRTYFSNMPHNQLADRFNSLIQRDIESRGVFEEYSYASSLFFYRSQTGYRLITQRLKYHSDYAAGRYFASMLGREMASSPIYSDVDAVIPVPLHWTRLWSRGHNQAEIIAAVLAESLEADLRTDILYRVRRTRTQTKLSVEGKAHNVEGAFKVRRLKSALEYSHILLVDDVFTTGATLHSCHRALRTVFPPDVRISVATLACVGM
ncbi:MAG TPA: hypothetical protein DDX40_01005 [Rikenellaceae bacterium]|nr:hypothetical protein [Rikenellaceae bacterium]